MTGSALFQPAPPCGRQPASINEAIAMPVFKANYGITGQINGQLMCGNDLEFQDVWQKNVIHGVIRCGNQAPVELNFFEDAFGMTTTSVETTKLSFRYDCEPDNNIQFEVESKAGSVGADFTATLHRAYHGKSGKYSMPAKAMSLVDLDTNTWYSIEDKVVTNDYSHQLLLRPFRSDVVGEVKKFKKYLVVPVRFVGGRSCPLPINKLPQLGYIRSISPTYLRRDWHVAIEAMRGYQDILRWTMLIDPNTGQEYSAWDAFEAQIARNDLRLAKNILAWASTPINNAAIINGTGTMVVDDVHTGFYGYLPSIQYAGGNVLDYDPSEPYNFTADFEPFMLQQESLKRTTVWNIMAGQQFIWRLTEGANRMVAREGIGADVFPAYERNGDMLKKLAITGYEYPGIGKIMVQKWGALSDSRLLGNSVKMQNLAVMTPMDGVQDNKGRAVPGLEFFQYGQGKYNSSYEEHIVDMRDVTLCDEIKGYVQESMMMAVHCPGQHILFNPIGVC